MARWLSRLGATTLVVFTCTAAAFATAENSDSLCDAGREVGIGNDTIRFVAVRHDFPELGRSTWYYKLISGTSPSISHVDFEIDLDCIDIVDAGTWGPSESDLHSGGGIPETGTDPTTGVTGIKFDQGFQDGEWRKYYFTVAGNLAPADDGIAVAIKGGRGFDSGRVCGPSPSCEDPTPKPSETPRPTDTPTPLPTTTSTPTSTSTLTPTITPTPTSTSTPTPVCGDGIVEGDESCDPGPDVAGDCCNAACEFEAPGTECGADDEPCTFDSCDEAGVCRITNDVAEGTPCDDGSLCTQADSCVAGACIGALIDCGDGFDCTRDSCHPELGCVNIGVVESRDCPGTCTDGINNDPADPNDPLHDPTNPERDDDIDFADTGCATLAGLSQFAVVATRDRMHRDLKLGTNTSVAGTEADGTCDLGTDTCFCPVTACEPFVVCTSDADCSAGTCDVATGSCECVVNCPVGGSPCQGDNDCLFEVDGSCDTTRLVCECPEFAPNCQAHGRLCFSDAQCAAAGYPAGSSIGGVCGHGMQISAGSRMGLLASITRGEKLQFGTAESGDGERRLDIQREFANAGGAIQLGKPAPFVGPPVCSDDAAVICSADLHCAAGACGARRRLLDGNAFESFDGEPGAGLAGSGTSDAFKRCDAAVALLVSGGNADPSILQAAIEAYEPTPSERLILGPGNCLECPAVESGDADCSPCDAGENAIATKAKIKKVILEAGGGLQVLDLRRLSLAGKTVLVLRGEADTELLVRVDRALRNGSESKLVLEGMTADQVLWVALSRFGGRPRVSGASTWRGSILATERRSGIFLGANSYTEGGIYSQKLLVKGPNTTVQHMPWRGKLPSAP